MKQKDILRIAAVFLMAIGSAGAVPSDQNWDTRFGLAPGLNGPVKAMAVAGTNLYIAGEFTLIGDLEVNGIARWDGANWHSLGNGIVGQARALATDGTNVFVGGHFSQAGNITVTNIARWNGEDWFPLGAGLETQSGGGGFLDVDGTTLLDLPSGVGTLLVNASKLYAGGNFSASGELAVTNIAVWNGLHWEALGAGLGGAVAGFPEIWSISAVKTLAFHDSKLYAGGYFETSGFNKATNLAVWDGAQWNSLGGGLSSSNGYTYAEHVSTLTSVGERLLVGGYFSRAGEIAATNLAWWNGSTWSAIETDTALRPRGVIAGTEGVILFGKFTTIDGVNTSGIARFDGTNWFGFGDGVVGEVQAAAKVGTNLYVGGNFQIAGSKAAGFIARWNGHEWQSLFPGNGGALFGEVLNSMAANSNGVYVTGKLISAGPTPVASVAHFNRTNWVAMDEGLSPGRLHLISIVQTNIYLVEQSRDENPELRRWNGESWETVDTSLVGFGYGFPHTTRITTGESDLYLAGNFVSTGTVPATNLARWDGTQWHSLNYKPLRSFVEITAMTTLGQSLFIAEYGREMPPPPQPPSSNTNSSSTAETNAISVWDGTNWTQISSNFLFATEQNSFRAMTCLGSNLFVGGSFLLTNPVVTTNILRWDGNAWHAMDFPFQAGSQIFYLASNGTNIYAHGAFLETDGSYSDITKWDGTSWSKLGSGIYAEIYTPFSYSEPNDRVIAVGREVYVAGGFTSAGGKSSYQFALWHEFPTVTLASRGRLKNGRTGLTILGGNGQPMRLQSSSDLTAWSDLDIKTPDNDFFNFEDETTNSHRFYRLRLLP